MKRAMLPSTSASRLQRAIHPEDPDAALREIPLFAPPRLVVPDQFAGVIDDSPVLVDGFGGEYAEAVQLPTAGGRSAEASKVSPWFWGRIIAPRACRLDPDRRG